MKDLIFKPALTSDIEKIRFFLERNGLPGDDISNDNTFILKAYYKNNFIGTVGLEKLENVGLLRSLAVKKEYGRKGFGKSLCMEILKYAKGNKIKEIFLLTCTAKIFFEKQDFRVIERDKVPKEIKATQQFSSLCPSTAVCLKKVLD